MRRRIIRAAAVGGVFSLTLAISAGLVGCGFSSPSSPSDCTQGPVAIAHFGASVAVLGDSYASGEGTYNTGTCSSDNPPDPGQVPAGPAPGVDGQGAVEGGDGLLAPAIPDLGHGQILQGGS